MAKAPWFPRDLAAQPCASRRVAGTAGDSPAPSGEGWWHSRLYLPHFEQPGAVQMITFRLADSLPSQILERLEREMGDRTEAARRRRTEAHLNSGSGACHLRDPRIAAMVVQTLMHFDGARYRLLAWVLMPNHAHILIETIPSHSLSRVVHSWKSYTAKEANKILARTGAFWHPEYFDRAIRDEAHFAAAVAYIQGNPVKAGLVQQPEDWPFSSTAWSPRAARVDERPALPGGTARGALLARPLRAPQSTAATGAGESPAVPARVRTGVPAPRGRSEG